MSYLKIFKNFNVERIRRRIRNFRNKSPRDKVLFLQNLTMLTARMTAMNSCSNNYKRNFATYYCVLISVTSLVFQITTILEQNHSLLTILQGCCVFGSNCVVS